MFWNGKICIGCFSLFWIFWWKWLKSTIFFISWQKTGFSFFFGAFPLQKKIIYPLNQFCQRCTQAWTPGRFRISKIHCNKSIRQKKGGGVVEKERRNHGMKGCQKNQISFCTVLLKDMVDNDVSMTATLKGQNR